MPLGTQASSHLPHGITGPARGQPGRGCEGGRCGAQPRPGGTASQGPLPSSGFGSGAHPPGEGFRSAAGGSPTGLCSPPHVAPSPFTYEGVTAPPGTPCVGAQGPQRQPSTQPPSGPSWTRQAARSVRCCYVGLPAPPWDSPGLGASILEALAISKDSHSRGHVRRPREVCFETHV